jgi:hypothetical protein
MVLVLGRGGFCPKDRRQGYHELAMSLVGPFATFRCNAMTCLFRGQSGLSSPGFAGQIYEFTA